MAGHMDLARPDGQRLAVEHRPGEDVDIALGALGVAARVLLDLAPDAAVVGLVLGNHVGQAEALGHGLGRVHVAGRCHVAARVAGAAVVVQFGTLGAGQAGIGIELVAALEALALLQQLAVQALHHEDGRLGLSAVQHGKGAEAQLALEGLDLQGRGLATGEEIAAVRKARGQAAGRRAAATGGRARTCLRLLAQVLQPGDGQGGQQGRLGQLGMPVRVQAAAGDLEGARCRDHGGDHGAPQSAAAGGFLLGGGGGTALARGRLLVLDCHSGAAGAGRREASPQWRGFWFGS